MWIFTTNYRGYRCVTNHPTIGRCKFTEKASVFTSNSPSILFKIILNLESKYSKKGVVKIFIFWLCNKLNYGKQSFQTETYWNGSLQKEILNKLNEISMKVKDNIWISWLYFSIFWVIRRMFCWHSSLWLNIFTYFNVLEFG